MEALGGLCAWGASLVTQDIRQVRAGILPKERANKNETTEPKISKPERRKALYCSPVKLFLMGFFRATCP